MIRTTKTAGVIVVAGVAAIVLSGCVAKTDAADAFSFTVASTDDSCTVSETTATSGTLTFDVANTSSQVSEFYLLAEGGLRIVGEVENIAPAASRTLTVIVQPGEYFTLCKPGMIGEGIRRAAFTVTGDAVELDGEDAEMKQQAVDLYAAFVKGIGGISNGAIALLDEVATGKISGEEDWWWGTDLWDFAANVEGSKMAFSLVEDFAVAHGDDGAALVDEIDSGYAALGAALAEQGSLTDGFISYRDLAEDDKRALSDLLNALAEPLSQLTGTVLS